jgi:hypothetical protein
MTEPAPPPPYPWLPLDRCCRWLQVDEADTELAAVVDDVRLAAASWCQEQRPDLVVDVLDVDGVTVIGQVFTAPDQVVQAGVLAVARLYARRSSPAGLASYGDFGAAEVLRIDPDVARLLGTGRFAPWALG